MTQFIVREMKSFPDVGLLFTESLPTEDMMNKHIGWTIHYLISSDYDNRNRMSDRLTQGRNFPSKLHVWLYNMTLDELITYHKTSKPEEWRPLAIKMAESDD